MKRQQRGAVAVEFALVFPILVIVVFGIIGFGIVFAQNLAMGNSARQAARSGVIEGTTCQQVSDLAKDSVDTIGLDGSDVTVTIRRGLSEATATPACAGNDGLQPCKTQPEGTNLYVKLETTTTLVIPLLFTKDVQVTGKGAFRCEFS